MSQPRNDLMFFLQMELWPYVKKLLSGLSPTRRNRRLQNLADFNDFIATRAAFVAQTTLYGYLRTRAGTRYVTLFQDDDFVVSMNIAKWRIYAACLSDLTIHATARLATAQPGAATALLQALAEDCMETLLDKAGNDGMEKQLRETTRQEFEKRLHFTNWAAAATGDAAFARSPQALLEWAPVADQLKDFDANIVLNSMRFKWQNIRAQLLENLQAEPVWEDWRRHRVSRATNRH